MTRRQVRAAMRRLRDHHEEAEDEMGDINLVPYLDIVTNVIIFLLASVASQVPLGTVNVSSPTFGGAGAGADEQPLKQPLNLTVTVAENGFIIAGSGAVIPIIQKTPAGKYDFKSLTTKLMEVKKEYPEETKATFNADPHISYDIVVEALDAMREDTNAKMMFPDVVFAAGIL